MAPTGGTKREGGGVAWMRMMEAESVAYHQSTVVERGDDFPGQALACLPHLLLRIRDVL